MDTQAPDPLNRPPRILGLIPARGGSKGIPGKNIKPLGGRPLIVHTIEAARAAGCLDRCIVSTDDPQIAEVARRNQAHAPWLRPAELGCDDTPMVAVVEHALDRLREDDGYQPEAVMVLQPTSPFRSAGTICAAVERFRRAPEESLIAVHPARDHPYWCKRIGPDDVLEDWSPDLRVPATRQELPPAFRVNGVLYLVPVAIVRSRHSLYSRRARALVVPDAEVLDIDTSDDWEWAEWCWAKRCPDSGRRRAIRE